MHISALFDYFEYSCVLYLFKSNIPFDSSDRMQEIGHEVSLKETPRKRSNSLPVPKIHVSLHCDGDAKSKDQDGSEPGSSDNNCASGECFWGMISFTRDKK